MATIRSQETTNDANCFDYQQKNKPQSNALVGAIMPIMTYGFYSIWGLYVLYFSSRWRYVRDSSPGQLLHAALSFYIGIIIGVIIGYLLVRRVRKAPIYYIAGSLIIISGALLIPKWDTLVPPIIARYIGGTAQGMAFITGLVHAPEVCVKGIRGMLLVCLNFSIASSTFTASIILSAILSPASNMILDQFYGGLTILYGAMGLLFAMFLTKESPVYLIQNNQERDAYDTLMKLRRASQETWQLHHDFQDLKEMINEENGNGKYAFVENRTKPLLRILGLRLLYTISSSLVLIWFLYFLSEGISVQFGLGLVTIGGFVIELIVMFLIEKAGRRKLLLVSTNSCGLILIVAGVIIVTAPAHSHTLIILGILVLFYGISLAIGLGPVSVVYLGEAFSLRRKAISILIVLLIENSFQILLIVFANYVIINISAFLIVVGAFQVMFGIYFYKTLPETAGLTIRECRDIMR